MQKEITTPGELLDEKGNLAQRGWMKDVLLRYDRTRIRAPRFAIKEWDYYCILGGNAGIALTIADNGYLGLGSVTLFDFSEPHEWTKSIMKPFPLGKMKLPPTSHAGDVHFEHKDMRLSFEKNGTERRLSLSIKNSHDNKWVEGSLVLQQPDALDTMAIATPFQKDRRFYYNQKINCMAASGEVHFGERVFRFGKGPAFGVLDWGRGVWTYENTWYWGSASGLVDGASFGFNIGHGFGDTSAATENMLFYKGQAHKLEEVTFHLPEKGFMTPWRFSSSDGRFEMKFEPLLDRASDSNFQIIRSNQHQVFGLYSGKAVLNSGKVIVLDKFLGFAEKVMNRW